MRGRFLCQITGNSPVMPRCVPAGGVRGFTLTGALVTHLTSVCTISYAESNGGIFILIAPLGITNTRTNLWTNVVRVICDQQYVLRAIFQQYNFVSFSKAIRDGPLDF